MKALTTPKWYNQIQTWFQWRISDNLETIPNGDKRKRYSHQTKLDLRPRFDVDQDDLKTAILLATDEVNPRRHQLQEVYTEAKRDFNLLCLMTNAYDDVLQLGGALYKIGSNEIDEESTRLLQKRWFENAVRIYLSDEFEGFKLLELGKLKETANGWELIDVKEFPASCVLPERGLILAHPDASNGLPFRPEDWDQQDKERLAEAVSEWLIECGSPKNLGLLSIAAKYSIYKKYGLGDWARSSEKWMDPTTIIRSGTDDETENDKKEAAASKLGNNNYMILDEEDQVDLLERRNTGAYSITKELLDYIDGENAKGINGQEATSNDQAWSGSSEVQERTQLKRTRRRARSVTYWLNETFIPKLIQLNGGNTAYSQFEGLEWRYFIFNEETNGKDTSPNQGDDPNQAGGTGVGKQIAANQRQATAFALHTEIDRLYNSINHHLPTNATDLDPLVDKMVNKVYQRKLKPGMISGELTAEQASKLVESLKKGYGDELANPEFASAEHRLRLQLQYNVHVVAAFKNHHNVLDIHALLYDEDGKRRSKSQFIKSVRKINANYNKHWAAAEWKLATGQAEMADKYSYYSKKGGSFVYITQKDGQVRTEHKVLHGVKAPVSHPIWDKILPKNGWGCRCYFRWISEVVKEISDAVQSFADELDEFFQNNPGKTGKVFNSAHPYFEVAQKFAQKAQKLFGFKPPIQYGRMAEALDLYNELNANDDFKRSHANIDTGGFVFTHVESDKKDLPANLRAAKLLADRGYSVQIRKHVQADGLKNPEFAINEFLSDLKTPNTPRGIKNAFNTAKNQNITTIVIEIAVDWKDADIIKNLNDGFHFNEGIQRAIIIRGKEVIDISREDYNNGALIAVLKK